MSKYEKKTQFRDKSAAVLEDPGPGPSIWVSSWLSLIPVPGAPLLFSGLDGYQAKQACIQAKTPYT